MASSMELEKDRPFDALVDVVMPRIKREFESVVAICARPVSVCDRPRTGRTGPGALLITDAGVCRCHGVYDGRGNVDWPGEHHDVGTDRGRLDVVSPGFIDAFQRVHWRRTARSARVAVCGHAAHRRMGQLPLPAQWQRPDTLRSARSGGRTAADLRRDGGAHRSIAHAWAATVSGRRRCARSEAGAAAPVRAGSQLVQHRTPGSSNAGHDFWRFIGTDDNRRALIDI